MYEITLILSHERHARTWKAKEFPNVTERGVVSFTTTLSDRPMRIVPGNGTIIIEPVS